MGNRKKREKINTINYSSKDMVYKTTRGYEFKIIDRRVDKKDINGKKYWRTKYEIQFISTNTKKWCDTKEIIIGSIKDDANAYVCGVGIVGIEIDHPQSHYLYDRWRDMLRRCYDKSSKMYYSYGECGVVVCDEWKYFPNYVRDVEEMENHDLLKIKHGGWQIDKDIIKSGNKVYCKEYCSIIRIEDNIRERNARAGNPSKYTSKSVYMFNIHGDFLLEFKSELSAARYITKRQNPNISQISTCCNDLNKFHTCYGYLFLHKDNFESLNAAKEYILNLIKNNMDSMSYKKAIRKVGA